MEVWAYTNLELPEGDLFTMWPSPSIIPTNISLMSSGIVIAALSVEDKRAIPFVDRVRYNNIPASKAIIGIRSC